MHRGGEGEVVGKRRKEGRKGKGMLFVNPTCNEPGLLERGRERRMGEKNGDDLTRNTLHVSKILSLL